MSDWIQKYQPCQKCSSSDGASLNSDGWWTCFVCEERWKDEEEKENAMVKSATKPTKALTQEEVEAVRSKANKGIPERGITKNTVAKYGVGIGNKLHTYPYYSEQGEVVALQDRCLPKDFSWRGETSKIGKLFGQHAFGTGGKYVTITEGALDAMAVYELNGGFPAVAVQSSSSAKKECQRAYEWLDSFDTIVIAFDSDEVGQKAAKQVAEIFDGKAKVMKMPDGCKDPCDIMKLDSPEQAYSKAFWAAERYTPDGIVDGSTLWPELNKPVEKADVLYPWDGLNALTYGIRKGELITITAGTGLGKSQTVRELVFHILKQTEDNIGLMMLEENRRKTGLSIMSLAANKPLHLPTTESTEEERGEAFDATLGTGRIFLFDHFGSTSIDNIVARVRYMAKALNCQYIVLDHVSIVISAQQEKGDERKALDEIMTKLRMLVEQTGICLLCVSHLKRPDGKGHEEGAATSLSQLRGSGSIGQLSDIVLGLERDGQAENLIERNTTHVRVLKNRFSGETGPACQLLYDKETGRMEEKSRIDKEEAL